MKTKFQKISWGFDENDGHEKYVIIQRLNETDPEMIKYLEENGHLTETLKRESEPYVWGKLVYGSSAQYEKSGRIFWFRQASNITNLDTEEVLKEHFTGLI